MKKTFFIVCLVMLCLISNVGALDWTKNTIDVYGTGTVIIKADTASLSVAVVTYDKKASVSSANNAEIMTKVQEALIAMAIDPSDISTSNYSVYLEEQYIKDSQVTEKKYRTTNNINVVIKNLENVGKAIDVCLDAGANRVASLRFYVEDPSDAYDKARTLAVEKAKSSATVLAKAAGRKLGKIIQISEGGNDDSFVMTEASMLNASMDMKRSVATPISSSSSNIEIRVHVVFELK